MTSDEIRRENMRKLIAESGGKQSVFADKVGTAASYISQIFTKDTDKRRGIGDDLARKIELACGKPVGWMDVMQEHSAPAKANFKLDDMLSVKTNLVPLISWVQAGGFAECVDNYHPHDGGEKTIETTVPVRRHTYALRVVGDSMEPEFFEGEVIVVEPELQPENGYYVIAKNGDEATFKQLIMDGGDWYLRPLNDRYPLKPLGDGHVIGVVREKSKRYC